jgi:small GTP-binding protein
MSGKTTLLLAFKHKHVIPNYIITNFNAYVADVHVDEKIVNHIFLFFNKDTTFSILKVNLALFGISGLEPYDHLRPLSYYGTSIVLICFSVDSPLSATNVTEK